MSTYYLYLLLILLKVLTYLLLLTVYFQTIYGDNNMIFMSQPVGWKMNIIFMLGCVLCDTIKRKKLSALIIASNENIIFLIEFLFYKNMKNSRALIDRYTLL